MKSVEIDIAFELIVLGSGAGASYLYDHLPSSSFMLLADQQPFCLVDLGFGVTHQVLQRFKSFPEQCIITHNHSDHAGELPVVARVELALGHKLQVFAEQEISERLKRHRLAEHADQLTPEEIIDWVNPPIATRTPLAYGLEISFYPGKHSEKSCGFILYKDDKPIFSYSADSQLEEAFYTILNQADTFIIDARPMPNAWHANFDQIRPWLKNNRYILGHGIDPKNRNATEHTGLPLLFSGDRLSLNPPSFHPNNPSFSNHSLQPETY